MVQWFNKLTIFGEFSQPPHKKIETFKLICYIQLLGITWMEERNNTDIFKMCASRQVGRKTPWHLALGNSLAILKATVAKARIVN